MTNSQGVNTVRHAALQPLSRDHHHVLELCSRIRLGLERGVEKERIRKYIDWFQKVYLTPHFEMEEQLIFPVLGSNARVKRALANHRRIKRLLSCSCDDEKVLNLLEEELGTYIRFEERTLYNEIQAVPAEKLAEIERHHKELDLKQESWQDPFWNS